MDKGLLYRIAYRKLNHVTPLKTDCGQLCSKACCKGDQETGMYLFPGETVMYHSKPEFLTIKPTSLHFGAGDIELAVCKSSCPRQMRPLSCRIFPLTPYLDKRGRLDIIMDPRAAQICPVARYSAQNVTVLNSLFTRNVREVFRLLIQDKEIYSFVEYVSRHMDEYLYLADVLK